jgi:hypothetical protein
MKKILLSLILFTANFSIKAQTGCTDPIATNFNINAIVNNGSCVYNDVSATINASIILNQNVLETSGLIEWNNFLYTHNDNTDTTIYKLNKISGAIVQSLPLNTVQNIDWEEISQDENYIYIGDFGNNATGNRTNLKIYKVRKSTLETVPEIETINFNYSNQTDFTTQPANQTDFDCEAFVVTANEILLFTKQWVSGNTAIYRLPKASGIQTANYLTSINVAGLITGATLKEDSRLISLCGYSNTLQPFIFLIYDYIGTNFTVANKRKIAIPLPYHQIEAIVTNNGLDYNLTNESLVQAPIFNIPQKLHQLSLAPYLSNYLNSLSLNTIPSPNHNAILYPNPSENEINFSKFDLNNKEYQITDFNGKIVCIGKICNNKIFTADLEKGIYLLKILNSKQVYKIIKK